MKTKLLKKIADLLIAGLCVLIIETPLVSVQASFNQNAIIPDSETQLAGVTSDQINAFFTQNGSQLADYTIPQNFDVYFPTGQGQWDKITVTQSWQSATELEIYYGKTIAQLVEEWSYTSRPDRGSNSPSPGQLNPLIALATMDKESASVTGSYRTDIVSNRPITLSWLMGYGFSDSMANCVSSGACDVNYNRQEATYYGGPGQQIAEGISALKRWSVNPTPLNSCDGTWQAMRVQNTCLSLQNGISYALYRYTPSFSGNTLFYNLYTQIKASFPFGPPPTPGIDYTSNDTDAYTLRTYSPTTSLTGVKTSAVQAWVGNVLIADTGSTSWQNTFALAVGTNNYVVQYKKPDGTLINQKTITITRNSAGDINGDGKVDILDLSLLSQYWGQTNPPNPLSDVNGDGVVDLLDLSLLANNFH